MKAKRIFALIGAILLLLLYTSTLVFALLDRAWSTDMLKISIACTIVIPVFLYGYQLIYRLTRKKDEKKEK